MCKSKDILVLSVIIVLFFLMNVLPGYADNTEIIVNRHLKNNPEITFTEELNNGILSIDNESVVDIKARVEPKYTEKEVLFETKELVLKDNVIECYEEKCERTWEIDLSKDNVSIVDYPKMELAWIKKSDVGSIDLSIEASFVDTDNNSYVFETELNKLHVKNNYEPIDNLSDIQKIVTVTNDSYKAEKEYPFVEQKFIKKDNTYLAKRELGLSTDDRWRYSTDSGRLILQKRFDIRLDNISTLKLVVDKEHIPELVQFSIDKNGNGMRDGYILNNELDRSVQYVNGNAEIIYNFQRILEAKKLDKDAVLLEPIFFLSSSYEDFLAKKPIKSMSFGSIKEKTLDYDIFNSGKHTSLRVNFGKELEKKNIWDADYKRIKISATFNEPQKVNIDKLRLYSSFNDYVPALEDEPGKALESWGMSNISKGYFERIESFEPVYFSYLKDYDNNSSDIIKRNQLIRNIFKMSEISNNSTDGLHNLISRNINLNNFYVYKMEGFERVKLNLFLANGNTKSITLRENGYELNLEGVTSNVKSIKAGNFKVSKNYDGKPYLILFEVNKSEKQSKTILKNIEYFNKFQKHKLSPAGMQNKGEFFYFFPDRNKIMEFNFPEKKYIGIKSIEIKNPYRGSCVYYVKDKNSKFTEAEAAENYLRNTYVWDKELKLFLECGDSQFVYKLKKPVVNLFGVKNTAYSYLDNLTLGINNSEYKVKPDLSQIDNYSWISVEQMKFTPDNYSIVINNNDFFKITSIMFDIQKPEISFDELKNMQAKTSTSGGGIFGKLIGLFIKAILFISIIFLIYRFRNILKRSINRCVEFIRFVIRFIFEKLYEFILNKRYVLNTFLFYIFILITSWHLIANRDSYLFVPLLVNFIAWIFVTGYLKYKNYFNEEKVYQFDNFLKVLLAKLSLPIGVFAVFYALFSQIYFVGTKTYLLLVLPFVYLYIVDIAKYLSKISAKGKNIIYFAINGFIAIILYYLYLSQGLRSDNEYASFAGIFVVISLYFLSQVLKGFIKRKFTKISGYIYDGAGSIYFSWAVLLLIITAFLTALKLEPIAEQVAVVVYYLLVWGTIKEIIALKKQKEIPDNEQ